jgi:hypothetical protein
MIKQKLHELGNDLVIEVQLQNVTQAPIVLESVHACVRACASELTCARRVCSGNSNRTARSQ